MGIALLKKLNTVLPDSVKIAFGPIIRRKLINGEVFQRQYRELKEADALPAAAIEARQLEKLRAVLIHAYEHTPYYKKLFDEVGFDTYAFREAGELKRIPPLTKELIFSHFDELQADDITDFYFATTGGSTGTPMKINLERDSIYQEKAFIYHFWEKLGYDYRRSRLASFRGTDFHGKNFRANPLYNEIQVNPCNINASTVKLYYQKLERFGAEFLHGFPSAIYSYCKFAKEAGLPVHGKYKAAFFISENVYDFQRAFIEETLGCPTAAFFGHSERAVFAEQLNWGSYSFQPLYGFSELSEGDHGAILCTGFLNQKMPLIRYELDDTAEKRPDGWAITGHRDGFLYGAQGEIISAAALEVHSTILDKIANYQFLQQKKGEVEVLYIPFQPLSSEEETALRELFQTKVGQAVAVQVRAVEEMVLTGRSKFRLILQQVEAN